MIRYVIGVIFFDGSSLSSYIFGILGMLGLFFVFGKSGAPRWAAFVPAYREYMLGQIAGREMEGRVLLVTRILIIALSFTAELFVNHSTIYLLFIIVLVVLQMIYYIYMIRVGVGMSEIYKRRKIWAILWCLFPFVPELMWGLFKSFQPELSLQELRRQTFEFFSGASAKVMSNGLTVNLEERTANDFMKKKYLLRDIHMYVKPGHMVLLLGGSGAGKSTLVNAINGYEKAKAEVVLNGGNVYKDYKKMQYEIGYVPQQDLMRGSDKVVNTLEDAADLRLPTDLSAAARKQRVKEVMDIFGLAPVKDSLVEKLSGGQRKRLSIAMEFISNPSLFILDEPDSGLDGVMARELMEQLRSIADKGKIVIVITHTPDRVVDLFDDVIVLAKDSGRTGRLAYFGPIQEAREFFGKERMEQIVMSINRQEEGGEGRADEFIVKYAEVQHA